MRVQRITRKRSQSVLGRVATLQMRTGCLMTLLCSSSLTTTAKMGPKRASKSPRTRNQLLISKSFGSQSLIARATPQRAVGACVAKKEVNSDPRPTFGSDETLEGRIPSLSQCKGCDPGGYGDCSVVGGTLGNVWTNMDLNSA
ncbi:hypothetical protein K443DRAFT_597829 [Laccaria amethystina LaAM-08-1]|uniref:Uncharacterized protein n=1 Tax=Laccaria amethystina LaAM-08-1 TaxID=1095629 RepID=A0A0C9X6M2_9AGAR|nr:hypothetical protein K443DRAFT_597829 [Laccaria amethystina LaAM-08-1]